jgi:hypothetical protein
VIAAPGIRDSKVRRNVLPSVWPNPGSNGSTTNRDRIALTLSSSMLGRCVISTA